MSVLLAGLELYTHLYTPVLSPMSGTQQVLYKACWIREKEGLCSSRNWDTEDQDSNPGLIVYCLGDLRQVSWPSCLSVSLSVNWG